MFTYITVDQTASFYTVKVP